MRRTPPFITPFAILSLIIILGASNVFENKVTHTREGAPIRQTRIITPNQNRNVPNNNKPDDSDSSSDKPDKNDQSGSNQPTSHSQSDDDQSNRSESSTDDRSHSQGNESQNKSKSTGNQQSNSNDNQSSKR